MCYTDDYVRVLLPLLPDFFFVSTEHMNKCCVLTWERSLVLQFKKLIEKKSQVVPQSHTAANHRHQAEKKNDKN